MDVKINPVRSARAFVFPPLSTSALSEEGGREEDDKCVGKEGLERVGASAALNGHGAEICWSSKLKCCPTSQSTTFSLNNFVDAKQFMD